MNDIGARNGGHIIVKSVAFTRRFFVGTMITAAIERTETLVPA